MTAPWFKCYPRDFNDGMVGLTLEERGAYITVLNLIYARGGPIPEDAWWLTSQLGCTSRAWTKLRAALIVKRKLYPVEIGGEPHLMNARAEAEIADRQKVSEKFSAAGKNGGRKTQRQRKENNDLGQARLKPGLSLVQAISDTESEGSVASPNGESTGGEPPRDLNKDAWDDALGVLVGQGGLTAAKARQFFGKLLSANGLEARDMLAPLAEAMTNGTRDPQGYLTRAAVSRAKRRTGQPAKRVGFV